MFADQSKRRKEVVREAVFEKVLCSIFSTASAAAYFTATFFLTFVDFLHNLWSINSSVNPIHCSIASAVNSYDKQWGQQKFQ